MPSMQTRTSTLLYIRLVSKDRFYLLGFYWGLYSNSCAKIRNWISVILYNVSSNFVEFYLPTTSQTLQAKSSSQSLRQTSFVETG